MRKDSLIKDKKILSALTIGISAMLFLQTPISAYAAYDGELGDTTPPDDTESSSSQTQDNYEPVTTEAQAEATQAQEACVSENDVIPATEEAPAVGSAQAETVEAADLIVNGDEEKDIEKAGAEFADEEAAPEEINNLVEAAQEVLEDKAEGSENLSNIEAAAADISGSEDSAKEQIAEAESANKEADKAYNDAVEAVDKAADIMGTTEDDKVPGLIQTQENIDEIVDDTNTKGQELVDKIAGAETEEEIEAAKDELDKLIKDSKDDLESQIELFNGLSESFDKAVQELKDAQEALNKADEKYQESLDNAENKTNDAQSKVDIASQKVDNLVGAMNEALAAIDAMEPGADDLDATRGDQWQGLFSVSSESSRNVMKQVIKDYYLTQVLGDDLVEDEEHPVTYVDPKNNGGNYERNYTTVSYYCNDNGEIKQVTRYFNWDSIAKADKEHQNHGYNGGSNKKEFGSAIVIYEKDAQEIDPTAARDAISEELLRAHSKDHNYYRNNNFMLDTNDNLTRGKQQGMFRLYSYIDSNGNEQMITQFELFGGNPGDLFPELLKNGKYNDQGDLTKIFDKTVLDDGSVIYTNNWTGVQYAGLKQITPDDLVTQNKNGLYRDANCLILGDTETISNVLKGEGGYSYVKQNVVDKYGISQEKVDELIEATAKLNKYIDNNSTTGINNLKDKYNTYATEVAEAQKAVENAQTQVGELSSAIDELRDKSVKKSKTMIAKDALGVGDIATHFGLTGLDEAQAAELNNLTLAGLISKLSELKKEANDKVNEAKGHLSTVIDDLINKADEAAVRPAAGGADETPSAGEAATTEAGGGEASQTETEAVTPDVVTQAEPEAAPVVEVKEEAAGTDATQAEAVVAPVVEENVEVLNAEVVQAETVAAPAVEENVTAVGGDVVQAETVAAPAVEENVTAVGGDVVQAETVAAPVVEGNMEAAGADAVQTTPAVQTIEDAEVALADAVASPVAGGNVEEAGAGAVQAAPVAATVQTAPVAATTQAAQVVEGNAEAVNADAVQVTPAAQTTIEDDAVALADAGDGDESRDEGGNGDNQGTVDIADEGVALAGTPDAAVLPAETKETLTAKQEIEDAAVPLASKDTITNETRKMSWWWLLIIALLGATGKKMYDEHVRKEEEKKNRLD
ncbi:hypothetical protein [Butyrivibrio sp. XPD2006]|uniref:hypothetical protein n=1 Tax=Butyrivibrio sp. XPD2006 TaxID=1280668 RepID=UPI0003B6E711|nr:hypothetical protein [Butyrivibrio sp. XPD2006]